jgi:hypothetical protein
VPRAEPRPRVRRVRGTSIGGARLEVPQIEVIKASPGEVPQTEELEVPQKEVIEVSVSLKMIQPADVNQLDGNEQPQPVDVNQLDETDENNQVPQNEELKVDVNRLDENDENNQSTLRAQHEAELVRIEEQMGEMRQEVSEAMAAVGDEKKMASI